MCSANDVAKVDRNEVLRRLETQELCTVSRVDRVSDVWKRFDEVVCSTGTPQGFVQCRTCKGLFVYGGHRTGTSQLRRHNCKRVSNLKPRKDSGQQRKTFLSPQKGQPLQVSEIIPAANSLQVLFNDGSCYEYFNVWLRDCCKCPQCWDASHGFRVTQSWLPDTTIKASNSWVTDEGALCVLWEDGEDCHQSVYDVDWLQDYGKYFSENKIDVTRRTDHRPKMSLWQSSIFKQPSALPQLTYDEFVFSYSGLKKWLELFYKFGFVILKDTPSDDCAIDTMANRVAFIRRTSFGYISEMKVGPESKLHPAYTGDPIQLHTDLTYRERSPGTLSMHCIEAADPETAGQNAGGMTKLVDGFYIANWLKHNHPSAYHMLTTIRIPYIYKDPTTAITYTSHWPVIGLDPLDNIHEIHFSNFARQPLRYPGHLILPFYAALKVFTDKLQDASSQTVFYLKPGDLITMNNRRILHARTGFDPSKVRRYIRTCYMDLDEVLGHYDSILMSSSDDNDSITPD